MSANKDKARLAALMREALNTGLELQRFSEENFPVFLEDNEKKIVETLEQREILIHRLVDLEKEIRLISDGFNLTDEERMPEFFENRRRLRLILDSVMAMDEKAKKLLEEKMRYYKTRTVSARNKKNISAYIKSGAPDMTDNNVEYLK